MISYVFMKILEGCPRSYDRRMDCLSKGKVRKIKEAVVSEIHEGTRVLEIGCGTGELVAMLAARGSVVTGFDISPVMVEVAIDRMKENGFQGLVDIRCMGVEEMDGLSASAFDAVVATLALSELTEDERGFTLRHSARVLKPGGMLVVADEVKPRTPLRRLLHTILRAPLLIATYIVTRRSTQPLSHLLEELTAVGFEVKKEVRDRSDAFALVVASRPLRAVL